MMLGRWFLLHQAVTNKNLSRLFGPAADSARSISSVSYILVFIGQRYMFGLQPLAEDEDGVEVMEDRFVKSVGFGIKQRNGSCYLELK